MTNGPYLTTGQIMAKYGVTDWQARRSADALSPQVPRVGLYRLIPRKQLPALERELRRRGYLREEKVS